MKSARRIKEMKTARDRKKRAFEAAKNRGDVPGKSTYAKKIARKHGNGAVDPAWMWWMERPKPAEV